MRVIVVISLVILLSVSCTTPNIKYQSAYPMPVDTPPEQPNAAIHFIELDDMGFLFEDAQLEKALQGVIGAAESPAGALVITFVHGWTHNAATDDPDLAAFRSQIIEPLAKLERDDAARCRKTPRRVVGVYVGWRGQLFDPPIPGISYYNRDSAARRASRPTGSEVVAAIAQAARAYRDVNKPNNTRSIVIGHSMGGLIVEAAMVPAFQQTIEFFAIHRGGEPVDALRMPADLVVLANPAAQALEAAKFTQMLDRWQLRVSSSRESIYATSLAHKSLPTTLIPTAHPPENEVNAWYPMIVSLTSETDYVTGRVFTAAHWLGSLLHRVDGPAFKKTTEAALYRHTAGHLPELLTHRLTYRPTDKPKTDPEVTPCGESDHGAPSACVEVDGDQFEMKQIADGIANSYWILQMPSRLVPSHGKILNPSFLRYLRALAALSGGVARPDCPTTNAFGQRREPPPVITTGLPMACDIPEALEAKAYCYSEDACLVIDGLIYELVEKDRGDEYFLQSCDVVTFNVDDHQLSFVRGPHTKDDPPLRLPPGMTGLDGILRGTITLSNPRSVQTIPIDVTVVAPLPAPISIQGMGCQGKICVAGVPLTVSSPVPNDRSYEHVTWSFDDVRMPEMLSPSEPVRFTPELAGDLKIRVHYSDGVRAYLGRDVIKVEKGIKRVDSPIEGSPARPIETLQILSRTPETVCGVLSQIHCYPPGTEFVSSLGSNTSDDYRLSWTVNGVAPSSSAADAVLRLPPEITGSAHIELSVTDNSVERYAELLVQACGAPLPVSVVFQGRESQCTAESVANGGTCWSDEHIQYSVERQLPFDECDDILWTLDGQLASKEPRWISPQSTPGEHRVDVSVKSAGGVSSTSARIRFTDRPARRPSVGQIDLVVTCPVGRCQTGRVITFSARLALLRANGDVYFWTIDGVEVVGAEGPVLHRKFDNAGEHRIEVTVIREGGVVGRAATVLTVPVQPPPPKSPC